MCFDWLLITDREKTCMKITQSTHNIGVIYTYGIRALSVGSASGARV